MLKPNKAGRLSRRNLLMGIGIGAASLSALKPAQAGLLPAGRRSEKHDIVVIGMGMSGTAAALQAKLEGADVIVLDKMPEGTTGGNSRLAGGMFITPLEETPQAKQNYYNGLLKQTQGRGNTDIFRLLMDHSTEGVAWMKEQGVKFNEMIPEPPFPVGTYIPSPGLFQGMPTTLTTLRSRFTALGGKIVFETKAKQLIIDNRGIVVGVRALGSDGVVDYLANAVIITTGGYAANKFILEEFVGQNADAMMVRGVKTATGDGLLMGQEAGAGVSGMAGITSLHVAAVSPVAPAAGQPGSGVPYFLGINRDGKRYVDESKGYVAHGKAAMNQPGEKVALIFDSEIAKIKEGPVIAIAAFKNAGLSIVEADTLEQLATKIEAPPAQLVATVKAFNDLVKDGKALDASPPKATLAFKVQTPKFYAFYPLVPGITLSFGGLMINSNAQVLEADGRVIGGLYAAGENAGAPYYDDYIGGGSLTNCLVMGRIAGRQAAQEKKQG
jgi:succinate dehydrogenase/fumarate reductase flavoprotein subunit